MGRYWPVNDCRLVVTFRTVITGKNDDNAPAARGHRSRCGQARGEHRGLAIGMDDRPVVFAGQSLARQRGGVAEQDLAIGIVGGSPR